MRDGGRERWREIDRDQTKQREGERTKAEGECVSKNLQNQAEWLDQIRVVA